MKKLALALLVLTVGVTWRTMRHDAVDPKLIFDRFWVDHEPRDRHEKFQAMFVSGEHPFGHFATRTVWTGQWEGFHYHVVPKESGVLELLFGNTDERQRMRYSARPCRDNGFDFCLDVSGTSRGVRRYYSRKEWVAATEDEVLRNLAH
jgi:hypothetical protein